jgi:uncharacterized membrane protein YdjX (TVP38/TMEM64 family)
VRVPRGPAALRIGILVVLMASVSIVAWRLGWFDADRRDELIASIGEVRNSPVAWILFVAVYGLVIILCLPATVVTIVGGALFGVARGAPLTMAGALLGTVATHVIARSIGSGAARRLFGKHRLLDMLKGRADVPFLIRLRVLPIAPFGVLDYVAGLAGVRLRALVLATAIGIAPGTVAYSFAGDQVRVGIQEPGASARKAFILAAVVTAIMAGVAVVPTVIGKLRSRDS